MAIRSPIASHTQGTLFGFPGGIHPPEHKQVSSETPIELLPIAPLLVLPLKQHTGTPAIAVVVEGDRVHRGQLLARAGEGRSAPLHAPADGIISFIGLHPVPHDSGLSDWCIGLCTDSTEIEPLEEEFGDEHELTDDDMRERIAAAGIVGLGGAGFPTSAKLSTKPVKYLIINGAECEPYITCDDRLMRERAKDIVDGIRTLIRLLNPERIMVAIEDNKPDAIFAMAQACEETNIEWIVIPTLYPSGAQKQLVQNLLGFEIPRGAHSIDHGVVMYNVGTCYAITRALAHSEPLISRIVTVTGNAVDRPGNYEVAIGTPINYLLECAGVNPNKLARVIMGGPIMGIAISDVNAPVTKLTNCLIAAEHGELDEDLHARECIRCGDCVQVCPASLLPQQLYWFIKTGQHEKAEALHLGACIECGACAYVCPSHIPLVQYYRHGKIELRVKNQEREKAEQAKLAHERRLARLEQEKTRRNSRHAVAVPASLETTIATANSDADMSKLIVDRAVVNQPADTSSNTNVNAPTSDEAETVATTSGPSSTDEEKRQAIADAVARAKARKLTAKKMNDSGETI